MNASSSTFDVLCSGQIDPVRCGVAVGWSSPGCAAATKGAGVHRLKGHLSWVQNGVSQFGLYLLEVLLPERRRDKYERNIPSAPLVYRLSDKQTKM